MNRLIFTLIVLMLTSCMPVASDSTTMEELNRQRYIAVHYWLMYLPSVMLVIVVIVLGIVLVDIIKRYSNKEEKQK